MKNHNLILNRLEFLQKSKNKSNFWNITQIQGEFISNLINTAKPKRILELGTSNGFSSLWMSLNLDKKSIIDTVDISKERQSDAKKNFNLVKIENINLINGEILEILPKLKELHKSKLKNNQKTLVNDKLKDIEIEELKYDFIFLDAAHFLYLDVIKKLEELDLLSKNFIMLADNCKTHDVVNEFRIYIQKRYYTEEINIGSGMIFVKKL